MYYVTDLFAQAYGSGNYDTSTYQGSSTTTGSATTSTSGSSGVLTNTGFDVLLIVTLAATLIFLALIIRFWKRPKKKLSTDT